MSVTLKVPTKSCNFIKKRLQHRCFLVNIAKFLRTPILKNICERLLLNFSHKVSNKYWTSLLNRQHNVGWFLLRRFVDLVTIYSLLTVKRNHFNTILLLDLQKNRSKVKYCSKDYLFWYHDFDSFRQVVVHYLMSILMICH